MDYPSKKIIVLLLSQIHVRNYIDTDAFKSLSSKFDTKFLILEGLDLPTKFSEQNLVEFIARTPDKNHWRFFELMMFIRREVSSTFRFRITRLYFPALGPGKSDWARITKHKLRQIKRFFLWILFAFLALPVINKFSCAFLRVLLERNRDLERKLADFRPDLIIMPTSGYDPINMEMTRIAEESGAKSLMIVDNWDNLSSKSVMYELPDYLSVWGQQSVEHATLIHGAPVKNVFIAGTPRFDGYIKYRDQKLPRIFDFKYLLFVGTVLEFDEKAALAALDRCVSENSELQGLQIIYRPHPWRQSKDIFEVENFSNVQLDPQIAEAFRTGDKTQQPDLKYYPKLLQNAEGVVGGMTTMLIEALLMRTPYLAMIWDDENYITNMRDVYVNYMHFRGTENISALLFNECELGLVEDLKALVKIKHSLGHSELDRQLDYFYNVKNKQFSDRLAPIVDKII